MTEQALRDIAAALQRGAPAEAERLSRSGLERAPQDENLEFLLALCLQQQGRHEEALPHYARLAQRFPDSALHWGNYATALREVGQLAQASDAARVAIRLAPNDATHYINLGSTQLRDNDYAAAQASFLKAIELDPASPAANIHAASALIAVRDAQAYTLLKPWRNWLPLDEPELQLQLAHLLMTIGEAENAHTVLLDLLRRMPEHLPARLQLAAHHERKNELDAAEALLTDLALRYPSMDAAARIEMSHTRATLAARRGDHAQARATFERVGPRNAFDYAHYFSLAEVCDKLGDTRAAMDALAIAHARQHDELKIIAPSRLQPGAPLLPNAVSRISAEAYRDWPKLAAPDTNDSPIFVVGFPRSGTTLLEQMLDAHPALQSMDERPFFTIIGNELTDLGAHLFEDLRRLSQRDCDELRKRYLGLVCEKIPRRWNARLVDKNPLNMLWLPLIDRLYPRAKIILCLRHPCDVVLSNYMQNYRSSVLAHACETLETTARAYVAAMEAWLYHVQVFRPDVMVSRYEDLVGDLAAQTQRIADFLELGDAAPMQRFDQHARDKGFIATPSYTQVIQPVSRKAVNRWLRYREFFEPVLPILQPMLAHWGYETTAN